MKLCFYMKLKRGAADRSYGVQVAKLAGLPDSVIKRSKLILEKLEADHYQGQTKLEGLVNDLPLFSNDQKQKQILKMSFRKKSMA